MNICEKNEENEHNKSVTLKTIEQSRKLWGERNVLNNHWTYQDECLRGGPYRVSGYWANCAEVTRVWPPPNANVFNSLLEVNRLEAGSIVASAAVKRERALELQSCYLRIVE